MSNSESIVIEGARSHNLKDVNISIPRNRFIVVTGLSGSGKSSLAFDTIYAEGQRRYMNTLSTYAKHFMGILEKPEVENITGLSPIIAIEQKTTGNNPRSTVGTITEIYDFLRLLYSKASKAYSPQSGKEMIRYADSQIVDLIMSDYQGKKCVLLAPLVRGRKGHYRELFDQYRKKGYTQMLIDGTLEDLGAVDSLDRYKPHFIFLAVDKLKPNVSDRTRISESVMTALGIGKGSVSVFDVDSGEIRHFSKHLMDPESGISLQEPQPHSFSFNSPEGYCPHCKGMGMVVDVNMDSIIPDKSVSIADGGIVPLGPVRENKKFDIIRAIARKYDFSLFDPIELVPDEAISHIIYGSEDLIRSGEGAFSEMVSFPGVVQDIDETVVCPVCRGTRLNSQALCFRIDGKTIAEVSSMEMSAFASWLDSLENSFSGREMTIARDILKELHDRVGFLLDVGLEYISLDRPTQSLSGGEGQRIRLATQIGSKLVNVLYILDEPSIGLHQRDNRKLIASLKHLRDEGNTVIVVEHDAETMYNADYLIDMGPGAGSQGGEVCAAGDLKELLSEDSAADSLTLQYLRGEKSIEVPSVRRKGNGRELILRGARGNNLKGVDLRLPLGCFIGVSGVSGSGKSTLINDTLMPILKQHFYNGRQKPLEYASIAGMEHLDKLIEIDQSPIGRTPRSNPATFTSVFNDIRALFEETPDARVRGFKAGHFSFNVPGGRCEACKGAGIKVIEMNFLPSVNVPCDECRARRYKEDTLSVRYKGKNINDVLEMPVAEAYEFFKSNARIAPKLKAMVDVGLGYVHLGQSAVTLSGGESQRMKLASELCKKDTGNTLYILDEPTTGLHFEDIKILVSVLQKLVDQGNTVVIIEHNLDVLKSVDYIIDLGPEGGERGGRIVAEGTPEQLAENASSVTGPFIKEVL